jgi:thiol-disulfide isomerase/thioredoxin
MAEGEGKLIGARCELVLAMVIGLSAFRCAPESEPVREPERGRVPDLIAADLATVERSLEAGGGVRVVNFWATWCKPCVEEIPDLVTLAAAQDGPRIIGISLDLAVPGARGEIESRVRGFLKAERVNYENLLYTESWSRLLDVLDLPGTLPYTLVVGDSGDILWRHEGKTTRDEIEAALARVLPERD